MIKEFYLVGHDTELRPVYGAIWKLPNGGESVVALYRDREEIVEVTLSANVDPQWQPHLQAKSAGTYASGMEAEAPIWQTYDATCWRGHLVKQQKMAHKPKTIHQRALLLMQNLDITPTDAFAIDDPHSYEWIK